MLRTGLSVVAEAPAALRATPKTMATLRATTRSARLTSATPTTPRIRCVHSSAAARAAAAKAEAAPESSEPRKWTPLSVRTGVIARKKGMTTIFNEHGVACPVTVLQLENCQVTANIRTVRRDHTVYHAVQVAASDKAAKNTSIQMLGHFNKAGVPPKQVVKEFPVTPDAVVPVGTTLSACHFVPGQYVDVVANSIGKGFQGGMKRWGFGGLAASHGASISHRSLGSTGQNTDPARVWPGRKMAGRLGNERTTTQNLLVERIDNELNIVYVRGAVPGVDDAFVQVRDAKKKAAVGKHAQERGATDKILPKGVLDLPFPAGTKELAETLPPIVQMAPNRRNPFTMAD
ncbi:translation protein [Schizophyllum commune]